MSEARGVTLRVEASADPWPTMDAMLSRAKFRSHVEHRLIGAQLTMFGQAAGISFRESPEERSARRTDARDRAAMARDAYDALTREDT